MLDSGRMARHLEWDDDIVGEWLLLGVRTTGQAWGAL